MPRLRAPPALPRAESVTTRAPAARAIGADASVDAVVDDDHLERRQRLVERRAHGRADRAGAVAARDDDRGGDRMGGHRWRALSGTARVQCYHADRATRRRRDGQPGCSAGSRPAPTAMRGRERVVDALQPHELQPLLRGLGNLLEVAAVARRQHHRADARLQRRQHLLLDAADRQHEAAQADLAGHRDVVPHRLVQRAATPARRTSRRRRSGRPSGSRRPARACGCRVFSKRAGSMPRLSARAFTSVSAACARLLHHVAELAGEDQLAAPGRARRLDEQDVAADRRPRETGRRRPARWCASPPRSRSAWRRAMAATSSASIDDRRRSCLRRCASRRGAAACRSRARGCARRPRACSRSITVRSAASVIVALLGRQAGRLELPRDQVALARSAASPPRCSRAARSPPCGRAAGRGCGRARSPCR